MLRYGCFCICASILMALFFLSPGNYSIAFAQGEAPAPGSTCATCHEKLYYLHDTGKWYCTSERQADCIVCHAGQADTFDEKLAHAGLIARPIQDNSAACQSCHGGAYDQYVQRFTLIAGVSEPRTPGSSYAPSALYIEAPLERSGFVVAGRALAAWQAAGLGLVAGLFLGAFGLGCWCWKKDKAEGRL